MTRAIEVGPDSLVQLGPRLPVSPRPADPLLAALGLLASDAVDGSVDGGHRGGHGGPDHIALAGGTVSTPPHSLTLSQINTSLYINS